MSLRKAGVLIMRFQPPQMNATRKLSTQLYHCKLQKLLIGLWKKIEGLISGQCEVKELKSPIWVKFSFGVY